VRENIGTVFAQSGNNPKINVMKRSTLLFLSFLFLGSLCVQAQTPVEAAPAPDPKGRDLPAVTLQDLDMKKVSSADFANDGKPIIISFWATWCKPCIQELIAIQDEYEGLVEETGVKLIAISIDDARNAAKVRPFVEGRGWEYEIYLDVNQDFKRALSINNVPHTFLLDGNRKIVWDHNSYSPGDEEHLFELVRALAAGKPLESAH
jgi:cytochrome c biogenesis protein CcmG, thiol:disulfide interchange protein DsbE